MTSLDEDWWPRPGARRPPRQTLDRAKAVETALEMIERDGHEAFSMRKLAAALGVGAPALYWHVTSREQLLSMVVEHGLAGFELPARTGPWREQLVEFAHRWWRHWEARPEVAALLGNRLPPIPTIIRNGEWVATVLSDAGLQRRDVAGALASWNAFLLGTTPQVAGTSARQGAATGEAYVAAMLQLDAEQFPNLRAIALEYANIDSIEQLFDVGLQGMISGFAALAAPRSRRSRSS